MYYNTPKVKWWLYCHGCGWESPKTGRVNGKKRCPKCETKLTTITENESLKELLRNGKAEEA